MGLDAALLVPGFFKGEIAQDVIDKTAHFLDAPAGPAPELRGHEIEDRDLVKMGPPRQPPVEAGIVDEDHGIGALVAEKAVGA